MRVLLTLTLALACTTAFAEPADTSFLEDYLKGTYTVIGKSLEDTDTYYGEIALSKSETGLSMTRTITDSVVRGTASIELATSDQVQVLRIRFREKEHDVEGTCLIGHDLNNYARLTCHLYHPGTPTRSPGLEAWFIKPPE